MQTTQTIPWRWQANMASQLRFPFQSAELIATNFSQAWQDLFVLSMLQGKHHGTYLEVGAHVPKNNNNTYLLHQLFGWSGFSLEWDPIHLPLWQQQRPHSDLLIADATAINYKQAIPLWFGDDVQRVDYLQLDIDPSSNTLKVLKRLPLDHVRFSVITFETDIYLGDAQARTESREILTRYGYELVASDVSVYYAAVSQNPIPFEDWWVDPQAISPTILENLRTIKHHQPLLPHHILFQLS